MKTGMAYIRQAYGVPAKRGARIKFTDSRGGMWEGAIRSAQDGKLRVRLDTVNGIVILHPTWNIRYLLSAQGGVAR